jgi:hypothetical protein
VATAKTASTSTTGATADWLEEGLPAYLESSKLEDVPLYQHFGFHVTGPLALPEGAPVVNTMWRPRDLRDDASPERA